MVKNPVAKYLKDKKSKSVDAAFLAYLANLTQIAEVSPQVSRSIINELEAQRSNLKLIASENYSSLSTQLAMGNLLTDKYAEGYSGHRFYAGCENVDAVESLACDQACKLFGCDHAYVQPHSGADANLVAYWAILSTKTEMPALKELGETNLSRLTRRQWETLRKKMGNQRLLGLDYYSGGHLTHGYRNNVSARMFASFSYTVNRKTGLLDYSEIEKQALKIKPLILLTGYSAYPRAINFRVMREIADKVGAVFMVDMAHFAGLVAGGVFKGDYNPMPFAQVVTTTTHKTLRGPRGGAVLCTSEFADAVNRGCPLVLGGPIPQIMAAKAVAFVEANKPGFKKYARKIVENARAMAEECIRLGMDVATGGTDNHLFLINVRKFDLTGRQAESALRECNITLNRNALPFDPNGPWYTSGLRIGTPAVTTLNMGKRDMREIASIIRRVLENTRPQTVKGEKSKARYELNPKAKEEAQKRVKDLLSHYPVYPEIDLAFLKKSFF
ncbi:MAG: glycine hydroxymethyltransferase [Deltaproteobacteria bacterium]|nr:glycine hydroxymethyltransferase [Deltaproteobacteria bacterium]